MANLQRSDLMSLEVYHAERAEFRRQVLAHKAARQVHIGPHATLYFEDRLTIQYQVQEMLRVERIFEAVAIQEELDAYNPLIPDGDNWKATFMLEYEDVAERQAALTKLVGIEDRVWVQCGELERIYAIADEDIERSNETKTAAVHFLRFQLPADMCAAVRGGATIAFGIDHGAYTHQVTDVGAATANALTADLA